MNTSTIVKTTRQSRVSISFTKSSKLLLLNAMRFSSSHHHEFIESKSANTRFQIPTKEDIEDQLPKRFNILNERVVSWLLPKWNVDQDDTLSNDKWNKFSAYSLFHRCSFFQNGFLLRMLRKVFDTSYRHFESDYMEQGLKLHEKGEFLYRSPCDGYPVMQQRITDYLVAALAIKLLFAGPSLLIAPIIVLSCSYPRKLSVVSHFTFKAELLPETEQVVFGKAKLFGGLKKITVDIKNLEKIDSSEVV